MDDDALARRFQQSRPRLRGVAQRMLGSPAEAEDAVQEAWLRLSRVDPEEIHNLDGWLTTVVAHVCLDQLRTRKTRREQMYGDRLPDPVVTLVDGADPEQEVLLADAVSAALLTVLDTLSPTEQLVFVLHDLFALPFDEIGPMLDRSPAAAKQLASRARRKVQGVGVPDSTGPGRSARREVVDAFLVASRTGDLAGLLAVLDPGVVLRADRGPTAGPPVVVRGSEQVAGQALMFATLVGPAHYVLVDGQPGLLTMTGDRPVAVLSFRMTGRSIVGIDVFADAERLAGLDLPPAL